MKNAYQFFLLFCTVLIFSACTNTQSKVNASSWDDLNTKPAYLSLVKPNLSGLWILNKELSENPQQELRENMKKSSTSRSSKNKSGRGKGSGEHSGKGNGGKRGNGNYRNTNKKQGHSPLPQSFRALLKASETLQFEHQDPLLTMIDKSGQENVYTDFRGTSVSSSSDPNQKITIAGWENNVLVVENTINAGRYIQQFKLDSETGQLWVNTRILTSHLPKPIQFTRVYEQAKTAVE